MSEKGDKLVVISGNRDPSKRSFLLIVLSHDSLLSRFSLLIFFSFSYYFHAQLYYYHLIILPECLTNKTIQSLSDFNETFHVCSTIKNNRYVFFLSAKVLLEGRKSLLKK